MTSNIHPPFFVNSTLTFSRSLFTICDTSTAFSSAASVLLLHSILRTTFKISVLRCALRVNFETQFRIMVMVIWLWFRVRVKVRVRVRVRARVRVRVRVSVWVWFRVRGWVRVRVSICVRRLKGYS